jgi:hypothetical protein
MGKRYRNRYRPLNTKELQERFLTKSGMVHRYIDGCHHNGPAAGYCWCDTHRGFLTKSMIEHHGCKCKNCRFLQVYGEKKCPSHEILVSEAVTSFEDAVI